MRFVFHHTFYVFIFTFLFQIFLTNEDFRGVWYLATIVEFPKPQPQAIVKLASKKKKKTIVQFKTLVGEDDFAPLVEQVDPNPIGSLPRNIYWKMVGFFMKTKSLILKNYLNPVA